MAIYLQKNYEAIDFSALKETNVFDTFNTLLFYGFDLIEATAQNVQQDGLVVNAQGRDWTQQYDGNAKNATHEFKSTDNLYKVTYVGSGIVNQSTAGNGVYSKITYELPFSQFNTNVLKVTMEGSLQRYTTGNVGDGTITKLTYEFGSLTVQFIGNISKDFETNTYTGTISGFNFKDANGQLQITEIKPPLSLAEFDDLTFNQLDTNAVPQLTQATESSFTALFAKLDGPEYKNNTDDGVIVDSSTSSTPGGVGSSTNPDVIGSGIESLKELLGSSDYYANGNELNNVMNGNAGRNFFEGRAGNDTLNGNAGDDSLKGEDGLDKLNGGEGNDILDGGAGKDTLTGGSGNDTYIIDLTTVKGKYEDKLVEAKNAGTDTLAYRSSFGVQSKAITLKLVKNFENLDVSLTNTNYNLTGNTLNNVLTGNAANNVLDGGKGADTLVGGGGADTYIIDNAGDIVTEALDADIDTVNVKFISNYALGSTIENGIIGHAKADSLTGNTLNNTLTGNGAANTLNGGDGDDTLNGGKGNDTLNGDADNDTLNGGVGNDTLNGGIGSDTLRGEAGNDTLNGGVGNDTLSGGKGKDTFDFNDEGTAGSPSVDTITDFSVKEKDVLDLRDLLDGESKSDITSLLNFIDISANEIRISSTGGFTGGVYNSSAEDAHITLNADLFTLAKVTTGSEADLLTALITKNNLIID